MDCGVNAILRNPTACVEHGFDWISAVSLSFRSRRMALYGVKQRRIDPGSPPYGLEAMPPAMIRIDAQIRYTERADPCRQSLADLLVDRVGFRTAASPCRIIEQRTGTSRAGERRKALRDEMRMQGNVPPSANF